MPADPIHPDQLDGQARFRADLVAYLDSLPVGDLAELLGELPRSRQQPLGLGVLMVALNERLPMATSCCRPPATPAPVRGGAAPCVRWSPTAAPPAGTLMGQPRGWPRGWPTANNRSTCTPSGRGRARWASGGWPSRWSPGRPTTNRRPAATSPATRRPSRSATGQDQERQREPEDDFGDSWRIYRERADHLRRTYGWTVPQPPPRAEPWLPLGRDDHQEHDGPPDRSRRWQGEERDHDCEDC